MRFIALLALLLPVAAPAQVSSPDAAVATALREVHATVLEGQPFSLHPRFMKGESLSRDTDGPVPAPVAKAAGSSGFVDFNDAVVCRAASPSSCRLRHGLAAAAVSRPVISGESAQVIVTVRFRSDSKRTPVASQTLLVELRLDGGRWLVREVRTLRAT